MKKNSVIGWPARFFILGHLPTKRQFSKEQTNLPNRVKNCQMLTSTQLFAEGFLISSKVAKWPILVTLK